MAELNEFHRIRKLTVLTDAVTTIAGTGARGYSGDGDAASSAEVNSPIGLAVDSAGSYHSLLHPRRSVIVILFYRKYILR